jgi:hypothetical protein
MGTKEPTRKGTYKEPVRPPRGGGNTRVLPGHGRGAVRWSECDADEVLAFVDKVAELGHAVTLGKTSDGGALAICVLADRDRLKAYR